MRTLQLCLSALCFAIVSEAVTTAGGWGRAMQFALFTAMVVGVGLAADFHVWGHESCKHKEPE